MTHIMDPNPPSDHYRVMVVDDSVVIRGTVSRFLESQPGIKVLRSLTNGQDAVNAAANEVFDVIVLDIQMPVMDGITAIPLIIQKQPPVKILISSTLSQHNATVSLECMEKGASDYISKPDSSGDGSARDLFFKELYRKVMALGAAARMSRGQPPITIPGAAAQTATSREGFNPTVAAAAPIKLRPWPTGFKADAIAIGSSTGGPNALFTVLKHLKNIRQPIFLTQHMPPTFTTILADHISKQTGVAATEAKTGDVAMPGKILLAPGGYHMLAERKGMQTVIRLDESPMENFCRPAVDPMLRSLISIYGNRLLVVILTGMGQDGLRGAEFVVASGGAIMAQDAATSVVWGMPGAVASAGICSAVLPLDQIGPEVLRWAGK